MIWSTNEELQSTLERVRAHCQVLRKQAMNADGTTSAAAAAKMLLEATPLPEFAVGSKEDQELHKDDEISTGLFLGPTYQPVRSIVRSLEAAQRADGMTTAMSRVVSDASSTAASSLSSNQSFPNDESAVCVAAPDDDDDDDEVEVLGVVGGGGPDC